MMSKSAHYMLGMSKLAQGLGQEYAYAPEHSIHMNPFRAPTPQEASDMESYPKAAILGTLGGGAAGTLLGALAKRNPLKFGGIGAGAGALAALIRHYDQSSDPPGLSPVYTIPSGLRLGALTGAGSGALLGKLTGTGVLPGLLAGVGAGAVGGGLVSGMV